MSQLKIVEINSKELTLTYVDNQWWIALKPICEALDINYDRQYQNLKSDHFLSDVYAKQHVRDSLNRTAEMICLPEKYIYGWIFSLNSKSEILLQYKLKCYDILYNHFHGALVQRSNILKDKTLDQIEAEKLKAKIELSEDYIALKHLKSKIKSSNKELSNIDTNYISKQLELWIS